MLTVSYYKIETLISDNITLLDCKCLKYNPIHADMTPNQADMAKLISCLSSCAIYFCINCQSGYKLDLSEFNVH
jgi:hypothetical protein